MYRDAREFFVNNVLRSYLEYADAQQSEPFGLGNDTRLAMAAATAAFHMREHMPAPQKSRSAVSGACPAYGLVGDVVNAYKHGRLTRGRPQIDGADDINEILAITEYEDTEGSFRIASKDIVITLKNGATRDLLDVLTDTVNFWIREFKSAGIAEFKPVGRARPIPTRQSATGAANMGMEMVQGEHWEQTIHFRRLNTATGVVEPIDLTGASVRMRIRKPAYKVAITLRGPGGETEVEVPLSAEQAVKYAGLRDDDSRSSFLAALHKDGAFDEALRSMYELLSSATPP